MPGQIGQAPKLARPDETKRAKIRYWVMQGRRLDLEHYRARCHQKKEAVMTNRVVLLATPAAVCALLFWGGGKALAGHDDLADFPFIEFDHKAIQYEETEAHDPIALLEQELQKGKAKLEYDTKFGYLPSLLKNLNIAVDSQILAFSKTSFQAPRISPVRPRAVFFNDTTSVGSVQNGEVFELVSLDPRQGEIFYTLDVHKSDAPSFHREGIACLQCHYIPATLNIPGILVSSVYPRADGSVISSAGGFATDHRIPIAERWGGWYVTGKQGAAHHRGNAFARDARDPTYLDSDGAGNLLTIEKRFNSANYLANTSDIVALLTLEHQTRMTNLITRLGWETRIAIQGNSLDSFHERLDELTREFVTYLVFADEAPIPEPIEGPSTFAQTFAQRGPRDKQGRSLRDFDLRTRLFKYPVSYMIYSEAFDDLPPPARDAVYRKLYNVLSGNEQGEPYTRLSQESRLACLEILRDTKLTLPSYWR